MSDFLSKPKFDVYRAITDKIVQAIEAGAGEFQMPWHSHGVPIGRPTNAATGRRYRGVNVVALWAEAMVSGYQSGTWATFRQWQTLGAHVRKGEHGSTIVFYKRLEGLKENDEEAEGKGGQLVARASTVFNASQVDDWVPNQPSEPDAPALLPDVDRFAALTGATIEFGGSVACYRPWDDTIQMPLRSRFVASTTSSASASYYAVLLHELTHWTGAIHPLDRDLTGRFGNEAYAFEELVAELGAAFLCGNLGVANEPRQDHAAYVASWLKVLGQDRKAIFTAAKLASHAAEYLASFSARS